MREILFKAKRADNGEWVEGDLRQDRDLGTVYISGWDYYTTDGGLEREPFEYEINPETLCQFTEMMDKNGSRIWENDIVYIRSSGLSGHGIIKYENGCLVVKDGRRGRTYSLFGEWKLRVDGNIFDNPEQIRQTDI